VSIAAIRPPAVIYREEQNFGWWIYVLLGLMMAVGGTFLVGQFRGAWHGPARLSRAEIPLVLAVGIGLPTVLIVGVLRMTTEVTPSECRVWFGWLPTIRRAVRIESIERIELVQYRPFADYGGWGLRRGLDGERVYNARGDRGVRLFLSDGNRILIGSQRPEELARALEHAIRPVG
jgi:hypothetical protein